jgi:hypothetical protein
MCDLKSVDAVDDDLERMARNEEVDDSPLDPPRDYEEADYQRLRTQLDTYNRVLSHFELMTTN